MKHKTCIHFDSILRKSLPVILALALVLLFCAGSFAAGNGPDNNGNGPDKSSLTDDFQINLAVGESYTLRVTGGEPPFTFKDYDQTLIDISPVDNHTYQITGKALGSTRLIIVNKKGEPVSTKMVTVINKTDKLAVVLDKSDIYAGDTVTPTVSGGVPPYKLIIVNTKIAELQPNPSGVSKILAKTPGRTQLAISDKAGQVIVQSIVVLEKFKPAIPLTMKVPPQINAGESATLSIDGGTPPYSVNVLNNQIIDISQTGINSFQITGKTPGTTQITVSDAKGQTTQQAVTVIQKSQPQTPPLSINLTPNQINLGESATLRVDGGTPPYGVNVLNSRIIDITQTSPNEFRITGKNVGITPLTVFDAKRQIAQKSIQVQDKPVQLIPLSVNALSEIRVGETTILSISGGAPPYKVSFPPNASSFINLTQTSSNSYQIRGKMLGQVQLTIIDANGQSVVQGISVVQRNLPLAATLPPEVSIGDTVTLSVIGGFPPYNITPNNNFVSILKTDNNNFQIKGVAAGKTMLVVFDKAGQRVVKTISIVPKNPSPLIITNLPQEIYVGDSVTLQVYGGVPPYNIALPNKFIADYNQIGSNLFQINAKTAGTVQITIFDQNLQKVQKTLNVIEKTEPLTTSILSDLYTGDQTILTVNGGTPPYTVTVPNNNIIGVLQTGTNSFQLSGKTSGKIQLTIFDNKGQSIQQMITVLEKILPLAINLPLTDMKVGDTMNFTVSGGTPPYFAAVTANDIIDITQSGTNGFKITAKAPGKALFKIYDNGMQSEFKTINVEKKLDPLNVILPATKMNTGDSFVFTVVNGTPPYSIANLNPDIADISQTTGNTFTISGKQGGKLQFIIYDNEGQNILRAVTINDPLVVALSTQTVQAGSYATLNISGGTPPYYVSAGSSDINVTQNGGKQFQISSNAYGDYNLIIFDSNGQTASKNITFYPDLLTYQLISNNLLVGKSTVIILSGGVMPYKVVAQDPSVVKVTPITEDIFLLTGLAPGITKIQISDGFRSVKEEAMTVKVKK